MNKEISVQEAAILKDNSTNVLFLDVREDSELEICRIDGAAHIPMGMVPNNLERLPRDKELIVFCHHGMRSAQVVEYLQANGYELATNLAGGIHAWAMEIDESLAKY